MSINSSTLWIKCEFWCHTHVPQYLLCLVKTKRKTGFGDEIALNAIKSQHLQGNNTGQCVRLVHTLPNKKSWLAYYPVFKVSMEEGKFKVLEVQAKNQPGVGWGNKLFLGKKIPSGHVLWVSLCHDRCNPNTPQKKTLHMMAMNHSQLNYWLCSRHTHEEESDWGGGSTSEWWIVINMVTHSERRPLKY